VAGFTDAIGKILCPKTSEILRTDPIHPHIAIAVGRLQPANEVKKPLQPITAMIRNPSSGLIMPSEKNQTCQD
jgi:hypothetical protein